jgi:hypothetical protein
VKSVVATGIAVLVLLVPASIVVHLIWAIFSVQTRKLIAAHPFLHGIWLLMALLTIAVASISVFPNHVPPGKVPRALVTMSSLEIACKAYQAEYALLPTGDNATITKGLRGANPRNIVFIYLEDRDVNLAGEVIDPWGTPYKFELQDGKPPSIRSAGPDHIFGDEDDLVSPSP